MFDQLDRLSLRLRVLLFFALIALGTLAAITAGLWLGAGRAAEHGAGSAFVFAGLVAGFSTLGLVAWVWFLFDEHVARAIQRLASGLRAQAHADVDGAIDAQTARYLGDLAPAAQAVAGSLSETKNALAEAVERETTRLAVENARLEALLADVPQGVVLCSHDHQIVFYNGPAQALLAGDTVPGLDRSILDYLRPGPVQNALRRLRDGCDSDAACDLLCSCSHSGEVFAARMRLVSLPGQSGTERGYVLTLREVSAELALHSGREALIAELFDRIRRPAANLLTVLDSGAARDAEGRAALLTEVERLAETITELGERYDSDAQSWWPMADTSSGDLIEGVLARAETVGANLVHEAEPLYLRCDAYQLVALVAHLIEQLGADHAASALSLRIAPDQDEGGAMITIGWSGPLAPLRKIEHWLAMPLEVGLANVTGRSVLELHGSDAWSEAGKAGRAVLRIPIPRARLEAPDVAASKRGAVYDFDLMWRTPAGDLGATPLTALNCVVFDTETTGLLPSSGDEIVQIAALRMVGGRRVPGEAFETLVDPERSIPPGATEVHHITEDMVQGAPVIAEAGRQFHHFARGAVLVAHNAPFDLEFFRRHEADIGVRFDNPVLDTVLLSAVVFGQSEVHTLDALADRLNIVIPPEDRHTAMGDTIATAAALEKLIPMLEAKGLRTFGEVITEVRKHRRLLKDVNPATPTLEPAAAAR